MRKNEINLYSDSELLEGLVTHYFHILKILYDNKNKDKYDSKSKKGKQDSELKIGEITRELERLSGSEKIPSLRNPEIGRKAREILEKYELIKIIPKGAQLKLVELTPFGDILIELILRAYEYNDSYEKMVTAFYKKILVMSGVQSSIGIKPTSEEKDNNPEHYEELKDLRLDLIDRGWKKDEINFHGICQTTLVDLKIICDRNFIDILLSRYSFLISEKKLPKDNRIIKIILKDCITKIVNKKVDLFLANAKEEYFGYYTKRIINAQPFNRTIYGSTGGHFQLFLDIFDIFYNDGMMPSIIRKEVSELVYKYLRLLEPFIGNLDYPINDMKKKVELINSLIKDSTIEPSRRPEYEIINQTLQTFIIPYENHCKDKNYVISFMP